MVDRRTIRKRRRRSNVRNNRKTNKKLNRKSKKKRTNRKNRVRVKNVKNLQIGGDNIDKLQNNIQIILALDNIEFLPTSKLFKTEQLKDHYFNMIDYYRLQELLDETPEYKESPTIQKLFDYDAYDTDTDEKIEFNYENFKCDSLISKEQKKGIVKLLFLYLLECNRVKSLDGEDEEQEDEEEIMFGGGEEELKMQKPSLDFKPNLTPGITLPKDDQEVVKEPVVPEPKEPLVVPEPKEPLVVPEPKDPLVKEPEVVKEPEQNEDPIPESVTEKKEELIPEKKDELIPEKKEELIPEKKEELVPESKSWYDSLFGKKGEELDKPKEELDKPKEELDKPEEERIDPEQEKVFLDKSEELQIRIRKVSDRETISISNNELIYHDVNWFNVCIGVDLLDDDFEKEILNKLAKLNYKVNLEKVAGVIETILNNEKDKKTLHRCMKSRLLKCLDKPEGLYESFMSKFSNIPCDLRTDQGIFYLYDEYRGLITGIDSDIDRLDIIEALVYCEARQSLLSEYIYVEMMRKKYDIVSSVKQILDKILSLDKKIIEELKEDKKKRIEEAEKRLADKQEKLRQEEIKQEVKQEVNVTGERKQLENRINAEIEDKLQYEDNRSFIERLENTNFEDDTMNYLNERERKLVEKNREILEGGGYNEKYIYDNYCKRIKETNELTAEDMNQEIVDKCL